MRTGQCPKCQSLEVYSADPVNPDTLLNLRRLTVHLTFFICASCGYLESYLLDEADRDDVRRLCTHVDPLRTTRLGE